MAIIFEDQLDRLDKLMGGEPSQFSKARAEILEPAFDSYLKSSHLRERAPPASTLQLVGSSDIEVKLSRCHKSGAATDLTITRNSDTSYDNFMGYCKEHECVVFKGETGLIDDFLDFVVSAAAKHKVNDMTVVLKAPDHVRVPFGGLEYGLKYEEFVNRVEVLQCAVWIRTSPSEQRNGGKSFIEIAVDSRTPPPSTPEYVPTSPDALIAYKASLKQQEVPSQSLSDSDSPLSSCGSSIPTPPPLIDLDSSSSTDSSELSDPPALIYTPPWLRDSDE